MTLGKLYETMGEEQKAQQAFEAAQEIVQALAARIEDKSLRTNFLVARAIQPRQLTSFPPQS